jgi:TetR/AcrR family transcriptional regulator, transcriptional repressor for nem operon
MSVPPDDTRTQLLDAAMALVEARGYRAFSYRDLAAAVGIRTASIHYHFPAKADLGRAMLVKHREDNAAFFDRVDRGGGTAYERLERYCRAFKRSYGRGDRICFAGMMATDSETLAPGVVAELRHCYRDHERWLALTLAEGRAAGDLAFNEPAAVVARSLFDALQGAMLATRAFRTPKRLAAVIDRCLGQLLAKE